MEVLARNLRALRLAHKLTQKEVARRAAMDPMHYHRIELEKWPDLRLSTLDKLAWSYGMNAHQLLQPPQYRVIEPNDGAGSDPELPSPASPRKKQKPSR